jgi:LytS/YehU family sensor histidine kinase
LLYRQNKLKTRQKAAVMEQKLLRSQMNPHFIFNSLIAIQNYIYNNEAVLAGDYLARFADLIRFALESSRNEFLALDKEINMMQVYLDLQKLRFENQFDYSLIIDEKLDTENASIPPMIAQPFVENAIEHGLRHLEGNGTLEVRYVPEDATTLMIVVSDNGVGRQKAREIEKQTKHRSMAMEITRERLDILSRKFKKEYTITIIDKKDDAGAAAGMEITIRIPLKINL